MLIISSKSMLRLAVAAKCFVRQPEPRFHFISHFMLLRHKHANDDIKRTNTLRNMLMLRWMLGVKSVTFQLVVYLRVCERSEFCLFFSCQPRNSLLCCFSPANQLLHLCNLCANVYLISKHQFRSELFLFLYGCCWSSTFYQMPIISLSIENSTFQRVYLISLSLTKMIWGCPKQTWIVQSHCNSLHVFFFGSFPPKSTEYRKKRLLFIRIREKKKGAKSVQRTITRCFQSEPKVSLYSNP